MCKRGLNCAFFHSKSERREVCKQPYKTEQLGLAKEDGINPTSIFENPNFSFTKGDGVSKHHGGSPWKTQTPMFTLSKDWPKLGELETKNCRESGEITRTSTSRNTSMTSDTSPSLTLTQEEGTLEASGVSGGIVRHRWTVHVSGDKGNRKDRGRSGMEMRGVNTPPGHEYMRRPPVHSQFVPSNNIPNVYGGMGGSMYQRSVANFPAYKINYEANNYYNQGTLGNYCNYNNNYSNYNKNKYPPPPGFGGLGLGAPPPPNEVMSLEDIQRQDMLDVIFSGTCGELPTRERGRADSNRSNLSSYMSSFSNTKGLPYYTQMAFDDEDPGTHVHDIEELDPEDETSRKHSQLLNELDEPQPIQDTAALALAAVERSIRDFIPQDGEANPNPHFY